MKMDTFRATIYDVAQDASHIASANTFHDGYVIPSLTIHKIPEKLLLHAFSFLRLQDLATVAQVCKKWRILAYDSRLWTSVSLRPEYGGLHVNQLETFMALIGMRFGTTLKYVELPCELITSPILHELANKCPNMKYMTLDFASAMQLHDFNDLNAFPCNLRSLCICLSEVIFLEGFMRRIYSCLSSLEVLHLIDTFMNEFVKMEERQTKLFIEHEAKRRKEEEELEERRIESERKFQLQLLEMQSRAQMQMISLVMGNQQPNFNFSSPGFSGDQESGPIRDALDAVNFYSL